MCTNRGDDANDDPSDVPSSLVDQYAEERTKRRREQIHHGVNCIRVLRHEVELALVEHSGAEK